MNVLNVGSIPTSLGEILNYKYHLDLIKNRYDQIRLSFNTDLLRTGLYVNAPDWSSKELLWRKYINDLGNLFFSEPPYILEQRSTTFRGDLSGLLNLIGIPPQRSNLSKYLCKGLALNTSPYVVITTKVREMQPMNFSEMFDALKNQKLVILGERKVEMRKEYVNQRISVFGIYDNIINNIPKDKIIDLTVPALGETVSDLSKIQQDCFIMHNAKCVVTLGIGGNLNMAVASGAKIIGYRTDNNVLANTMYNGETNDFAVTKNWSKFIDLLKSRL